MNNFKGGNVERLYKKLDKEAESGGYHLNPDEDFTKRYYEISPNNTGCYILTE